MVTCSWSYARDEFLQTEMLAFFKTVYFSWGVIVRSAITHLDLFKYAFYCFFFGFYRFHLRWNTYKCRHLGIFSSNRIRFRLASSIIRPLFSIFRGLLLHWSCFGKMEFALLFFCLHLYLCVIISNYLIFLVFISTHLISIYSIVDIIT